MANTPRSAAGPKTRRQYENMKMITDNLLKPSSLLVPVHVPLSNHRSLLAHTHTHTLCPSERAILGLLHKSRQHQRNQRTVGEAC